MGEKKDKDNVSFFTEDVMDTPYVICGVDLGEGDDYSDVICFGNVEDYKKWKK